MVGLLPDNFDNINHTLTFKIGVAPKSININKVKEYQMQNQNGIVINLPYFDLYVSYRLKIEMIYKKDYV